MTKNIRVYLEDIVDSANKIAEYIQGMSEGDFYKDYVKQDAVMRRLEIIGEAVKRIPADYKQKHVGIPWRQIAGMRDVLIHEYSEVDISRVWQATISDVPLLKDIAEKLLRGNDHPSQPPCAGSEK